MDMIEVAIEAKKDEEAAIIESRTPANRTSGIVNSDGDSGIATKFEGIRIDHNGFAYVENPGAANGVSAQHIDLQRTLAGKTVRDLEIERDADIKTEAETRRKYIEAGQDARFSPAALARLAAYGDDVPEKFKEQYMSDSTDQVKVYERVKADNPNRTRVPPTPPPQPQPHKPVTPPPVVNPTHPGDHDSKPKK